MTRILTKLDARIPNWKLDELVSRPCPFCGTHERQNQLQRPDGLSVAQCSTCESWYLPETPSSRQLDEFYSNYDKTHRRTPASLGADYIPRVLDTLRGLNWIQNKRYLDVGFGRAHFLSEVKKRGGAIAGVELDESMVQYAKNQMGIRDVWCGTVFDVPKTEKFDAILLGDLIEHPIQPRELLQEAFSHLNPQGLLIIITPNAGGAKNELEPVLFRVDLEHLQYLSPESISYLAKELNAEVVTVEEYGHPNLFEIGKKPSEAWMTRTISATPGFHFANRLRQWLGKRFQKEGKYHLFCILRKK